MSTTLDPVATRSTASIPTMRWRARAISTGAEAPAGALGPPDLPAPDPVTARAALAEPAVGAAPAGRSLPPIPVGSQSSNRSSIARTTLNRPFDRWNWRSPSRHSISGLWECP